MLPIMSFNEGKDAWVYWQDHGKHSMSYINDIPSGGYQVTMPLPPSVLTGFATSLNSGPIEDRTQYIMDLPDGHHL